MSKRLIATALALLLAPSLSLASSELTIKPDGTFVAKGLTIIQIAGNNLFTRANWGNAFIRVTVLVGTSTSLTKQHGESMRVANMDVGHLLDVTGALASGTDNLVINAATIRDSALVQESKALNGTIASINQNALSFVMPNTQFGRTTVVVSPSITIKKGERTIDFADLAVGDKVLAVSGTYDYPSNTMTSRSIEIFQPKDMFVAKNFEGSLKSLSGSALPVNAIITVSGTDYTVYLTSKTSVLNSAKKASTLKRFAEGDTVRFFGAIRQTNFGEIDAEIIRDLNF